MNPRQKKRINVLQDVYDSGILSILKKPRNREVLVFLAYSANSDTENGHYRWCWPKQETIALKCGLTSRTVRSATKTLAELGIIERKMKGKLYWYKIADYPELCDLREEYSAAILEKSDRPFPVEKMQHRKRDSTGTPFPANGGTPFPVDAGTPLPPNTGNGLPLRSKERTTQYRTIQVEEGGGTEKWQ